MRVSYETEFKPLRQGSPGIPKKTKIKAEEARNRVVTK